MTNTTILILLCLRHHWTIRRTTTIIRRSRRNTSRTRSPRMMTLTLPRMMTLTLPRMMTPITSIGIQCRNTPGTWNSFVTSPTTHVIIVIIIRVCWNANAPPAWNSLMSSGWRRCGNCWNCSTIIVIGGKEVIGATTSDTMMLHLPLGRNFMITTISHTSCWTRPNTTSMMMLFSRRTWL